MHEMLIYALDLFGTFVFAIAGGFKAVKHELDILGVFILATITGIGGGILRDVLIGATPVAAFTDPVYFAVCLLGGVLVIIGAMKIARVWLFIKVADAIGLGVFTAIGVAKAYELGLGYVGVVMAGMLTATGGGVIRDVLVQEVPLIIKSDFYATASFIGGTIFFFLTLTPLSSNINMVLTMVIVTIARIVAMIYNFNLPKVKRLPAEPREIFMMEREKRKKH
ncbi:MAG: trimeric intracellular cation channel family protein [Spirochaetales bacterium]|nr:trimeric intracellular cation channel family protein [Spirochaetales bacterium]